MNVLNAIREPYYLYRPGQILRRLHFSLRQGKTNPLVVKLPWGSPIRCDPGETLGYCLGTTGVYDLALSELVWRSVETGEAAVDIGANIGYVTSIMAWLSGALGKVYAFEPHPHIFAELEANSKRWSKDPRMARISSFQVALGDSSVVGQLREPTDGFESNHGLASLSKAEKYGGRSYCVQVRRLDELPWIGNSIGVVKIDVEGHEAAVFRGADRLLRARAIRDIIFEEFSPYPADTHLMLEGFGYVIFHITAGVFGPSLIQTSRGYQAPANNAPNYLATVDPDRAIKRFRPRGWRCLLGRNARSVA